MKSAVFAILFAAGLTACSQDVTAPVRAPEAPLAAAGANVSLGQPFELRVGRSATVAGEGLTVSFEAVSSDSRCPTGVQCVWAPEAGCSSMWLTISIKQMYPGHAKQAGMAAAS